MSSLAHPADGELRALLDEELAAARRQEVAQHLDACTECRRRLSAIQGDVSETDALLNLLAPSASAPSQLRADAIVRRARRTRVWWTSVAAVLALTIATIAGATVGRPYVGALIARIRGTDRQPTPPSRGPSTPPGIAFVPGPMAEISFDARQATGTLRLSLADTSELIINPTAAVTYRVHPGGVIVHNRGSDASFTLIVPRRAPHVRVVVAGRVLFEKSGSGISTTAAETAGGYTLDMR